VFVGTIDGFNGLPGFHFSSSREGLWGKRIISRMAARQKG
jgi:hypothetical protein